jgi:hypothetical protein
VHSKSIQHSVIVTIGAAGLKTDLGEQEAAKSKDATVTLLRLFRFFDAVDNDTWFAITAQRNGPPAGVKGVTERYASEPNITYFETQLS